MTGEVMRVELVPVGSLTPDPRNARKHDDRNLAAIRASLAEFGQRRALVVTHEGVVIAGNGTLEVAKALGWEQITVHRTPPDWDYDRARAYALADNRTAELADWDSDVLAEHLLELDAVGWDVSDLGFEPLTPVVDQLEPEVADETDATPPVNPVSSLGDVWVLGRHRVICGDASDVTAYDRVLEQRLADMVWTDPPYGVAYVGKTKDAMTIQNDALSSENLREFLAETLGAAYTATRPGGAWYVASPPGDIQDVFGAVLADLGLRRHTLVWAKDQFVLGRSDYHYRHETIFYGWKEGAAHTWNGGRKQDSVLEIPRPKRNADHPTMKPVRLVARMVENSSDPGSLVLDPFGGSGTTLLAAHSTGRDARLIELDPRYVDVICRRYQEATGDVPVLERTGEGHDFLAVNGGPAR